MYWTRGVTCRLREWRAARARWRADMRVFKAAQKEARRTGAEVPENPGPPPTAFSLLPWLLMGLGAFSNLFQGKTPNPWIGGLGLLAFNSLYIYVAVLSFVKEKRQSAPVRVALLLMAAITCGLAGGYGGNWLLFFPLLGLATGAALRGGNLRWSGTAVAALAAVVSALRDGWSGLTIAYATWISTMVTAAILSLSEAVRELRAAREELAHQAVEKERLRFSRDLHDLLGHTMSVIVVKSEAARRLAPRDLDAALGQITDIESVGRQALTEIREAVTGYREGSLGTELDRARSVLAAAGVEPVVTRSGAPLAPQCEALLGWVVREAVTNVVRHSGATRCEIGVVASAEHVRLTVSDNGDGRDGDGRDGDGSGGRAPDAASGGVGGTGLKGLTERLAAAGGSLRAGPSPRGGFTVTAELPSGQAESAQAGSVTATRAT